MQLLSSGIVLTSFIAGIVALLAPCCVSVMLPAYFASGLRRRRQIVGMTFVFAAGVGTVILPIALGASAVSGLLQSRHTPIFATGGALMILAGLATLAGRAPTVPMPFSAPLGPSGDVGGVAARGVLRRRDRLLRPGPGRCRRARRGSPGRSRSRSPSVSPTCSAWSRRSRCSPWSGTCGTGAQPWHRGAGPCR